MQTIEIKQTDGIAGIASFFIPGLGQFLQGRIISAAFLFILVPCGYLMFIFPGILFHLITVYDAAANGPKQKIVINTDEDKRIQL